MEGQRRNGVIVLGCTHSGLAVTRSLARRGIPVIGLTHDASEFGLKSRYLKEWHLCPHPLHEAQFIDFLVSKASDWSGALLLETSDYFMTALSRNKAILSEHYRVSVADWDVVQIFLEKDKLYTHADQCGVAHPNSFQPQTMDELNAVADQFRFPVMIKPVLSHEFVKIFGKKMMFAGNLEELRSMFQLTLGARQPVILSEIIPGTDYETLEKVYMYVNTKGEVAAEVFNVKLRQTPPMYGVMRVGKTTPPNPEVRELSAKLLKSLDYHGFADVEFKRDPRDQQLKLIEVNVRTPRCVNIGIGSGVDFPWLMYQDIVCDEQVSVNRYQENSYYIEFLADVADFIRKDEQKDVKAFIKPYLARHKIWAIWSLSDPMPFLSRLGGRMLRGSKKPERSPTMAGPTQPSPHHP
jgi:D-aspartate ligase